MCEAKKASAVSGPIAGDLQMITGAKVRALLK